MNINMLNSNIKKPSERFFEYMNTLIKSSDYFKKDVNRIRRKYLRGKKVTLSSAVKIAESKEVTQLFEKFLIKDLNEHREYVIRYINYNEWPEKYIVHYLLDASDKRECKIPVKRPSIWIGVFGSITEEEWRSIWTRRIKKGHSEVIDEIESKKISIHSLGKLNKRMRTWRNIDLYLFIYWKRKAGLKPQKIVDQIKKERNRQITSGFKPTDAFPSRISNVEISNMLVKFRAFLGPI